MQLEMPSRAEKPTCSKTYKHKAPVCVRDGWRLKRDTEVTAAVKILHLESSTFKKNTKQTARLEVHPASTKPSDVKVYSFPKKYTSLMRPLSARCHFCTTAYEKHFARENVLFELRRFFFFMEESAQTNTFEAQIIQDFFKKNFGTMSTTSWKIVQK